MVGNGLFHWFCCPSPINTSLAMMANKQSAKAASINNRRQEEGERDKMSHIDYSVAQFAWNFIRARHGVTEGGTMVSGTS